MAGQGRRALPYSYRTASEYHKRHDFNPLKNIKVSYFLPEATLAALAWVWVVASREYVFSTPDLVWQILIIVAIVIFAGHLVLYLLKLVFYPRHGTITRDRARYRARSSSAASGCSFSSLMFFSSLMVRNCGFFFYR
jgi:hypothetical protein